MAKNFELRRNAVDCRPCCWRNSSLSSHRNHDDGLGSSETNSTYASADNWILYQRSHLPKPYRYPLGTRRQDRGNDPSACASTTLRESIATIGNSDFCSKI